MFAFSLFAAAGFAVDWEDDIALAFFGVGFKTVFGRVRDVPFVSSFAVEVEFSDDFVAVDVPLFPSRLFPSAVVGAMATVNDCEEQAMSFMTSWLWIVHGAHGVLGVEGVLSIASSLFRMFPTKVSNV